MYICVFYFCLSIHVCIYAAAYLQQFVLHCCQLQVMSLLPGDSVQAVSDLLQSALQGLQAGVSLSYHPSGHHER